eukprot:349740-Chlamydomonas_euryale.AAC.5
MHRAYLTYVSALPHVHPRRQRTLPPPPAALPPAAPPCRASAARRHTLVLGTPTTPASCLPRSTAGWAPRRAATAAGSRRPAQLSRRELAGGSR